MNKNNNISQGVDWTIVWLYATLVSIGILCIFMVEYRTDSNWMQIFISGKTNYSKQLIFAVFCAIVATLILLTDSKLFTALANLLYVFGILLMLATFVLGKNINGSRSWIPIGAGFNLQPAELCKIFTALALAKFLSRQETEFSTLRSQLVAGLIVFSPAVLSILQHELGLALVYSAFLVAMYREGLPAQILIFGSSFAILVIASLILDPTVLVISLTALAGIAIYFFRKQIKRSKRLFILIAGIWIFCVATQRLLVPYIFNNVLECYQSTRIYSMLGKEYNCGLNKKSERKVGEKAARKPDDYNVRQSKIAIGSGGLTGRGFLKGTQTRGKYVPEQHTDFIFTSLGEAFGFIGCFVFLGIYLFLLFRIVKIAERQRSIFSRVYAYSVASIIFFHIAVNVSMTIGLFPIVGIPLPLISYGGSSLLTFTVLIFILLRLDADRQMVLR